MTVPCPEAELRKQNMETTVHDMRKLLDMTGKMTEATDVPRGMAKLIAG